MNDPATNGGTMLEAWNDLRNFCAGEALDYAKAQDTARSKDAKMVFAALAGAYGGVVRKMDALEEGKA
jgi:hypothetical protein